MQMGAPVRGRHDQSHKHLNATHVRAMEVRICDPPRESRSKRIERTPVAEAFAIGGTGVTSRSTLALTERSGAPITNPFARIATDRTGVFLPNRFRGRCSSVLRQRFHLRDLKTRLRRLSTMERHIAALRFAREPEGRQPVQPPPSGGGPEIEECRWEPP